jgi:flagellar biosynthetic protein FliP
MTKAAGQPLPEDRTTFELRTLIPAFLLSELRGAFIIGFVIFVPFLVVDIVVSAILMSLGMVMLPPSMISLPFRSCCSCSSTAGADRHHPAGSYR